MRLLFISGLLAAFWLLLSGHYVPLILALGAVSVVLVTWFVNRMDKVDGEPLSMRLGFGLVGYLAWLMWQVVLSNVTLARRIWDPRLPIRPTWQRLDTSVSTPLEKTLYANSITLTPGTLTTDVKRDHFMIHSLSPEGMEDLRQGEMEGRIRRLRI